MSDPLADFCRARLPAAALPSLGPLRATAELRALIRGEELWLFWPAGEPELGRAVLALDGAELFGFREGNWRRPGASLPTFGVPEGDEARPLSSLLTPAPFEPVPPGAAGWVPLTLRLVGYDVPRPCTLMRLSLAELARWADRAATHELSALSVTHDRGTVLLRGAKLPPLPGERFWGRRVLFPLGRRPEPDLGEDVLAAALRLEAGELAVVTAEGAELVPLAAFAPLTRAGVRLACREAKT